MEAKLEQSPSSTATNDHGIALAEGEIYVGITLHENKPHHLILLAGDISGSWKRAQAFAEKAGGVLPSRIDMLVLFERARDEFERDWYWTSQEYAGGGGFAWCQFFGDGYQSTGRKGGDCRARAVRRVPLQ